MSSARNVRWNSHWTWDVMTIRQNSSQVTTCSATTRKLSRYCVLTVCFAFYNTLQKYLSSFNRVPLTNHGGHIVIKAIYKVQDHLRATSAICRQQKCLLSKQKSLQLCSKSLNRDISWSVFVNAWNWFASNRITSYCEKIWLYIAIAIPTTLPFNWRHTTNRCVHLVTVIWPFCCCILDLYLWPYHSTLT